MRSIILISEDRVKTVSNLDNNVFGKWLLPAIREAQDVNLQSIIGSTLYNQILTLVDSGDIALPEYDLYKDLLDNQIADFLIYQSLVNVIPLINVNMANMGTVISNDEHIQTLSQGNVDLVRGYYQNLADIYQKRLQDFLKCHREYFPELNDCACDNCGVKPNLNSNTNTSGIWLGGLRNPKKVRGTSECCFGGSKSSSTDCQEEYNRGFRDGKTQQKSLLVATAFTENGEYQRENGWSGVTVNVPQTGQTINNQILGTTLNSNGFYQFTYQSGYTGLERVDVTVDVAQTGYTQDDLDNAYQSGRTDQKNLLEATIFTENGVYIKENGYSAITVDVAQTGYTQDDLDNAYQSGYTSGVTDGENQQKAKLTTTAFTENGVYTRENGWSEVSVNVPTDISYHRLTIDFSNSERDSGLINNAIVTISGAGSSNSYTFTGASIVVDLLPGVSYVVSYSDVEDYTKPSNDTVVTTWGGSSTLYPVYVYNEDVDISVSPDTNNLHYNAQTLSLSVSSNTSWIISSYPEWAVPNTTAGTGNATVVVTLPENTGDERRTNIIFETVSGSSSASVYIRQGYKNYSDEYLTFDITSDGYINWMFKPCCTNEYQAEPNVLLYSKNGGEWIPATATTGGTHIDVVAGDKVRMKQTDGGSTHHSTSEWCSFRDSTCGFKLYGNLMSLFFPDTFAEGSKDFAKSCGRLFWHCSGLTDARNLVISVNRILVNRAFESLFYHCDNLVSAPRVISATQIVGTYVYMDMFGYCGSLTTLPNFTLTSYGTDGTYAFYGTFRNCYSLTTAPENMLPNVLGVYCYNEMFYNCISLTTVPKLPVTELKQGCYWFMFGGCTSLQIAPELPATSLKVGCYARMFEGCTNLNYIKCLATNISASNCTSSWVANVQTNSGTFVKASTMADWNRGQSGIPDNWTVQNNS